jgi:hypothetical protein
MNDINKELAQLHFKLLFQDPETGEELFPCAGTKNENGQFIFEVYNKSGRRGWKHTIKTEKISAIKIPYTPPNNTKTHERAKIIAEKFFVALKDEGVENFFASLMIDGEATDLRIVDNTITIETSKVERDISRV